jgi:hypothetical protein
MLIISSHISLNISIFSLIVFCNWFNTLILRQMTLVRLCHVEIYYGSLISHFVGHLGSHFEFSGTFTPLLGEIFSMLLVMFKGTFLINIIFLALYLLFFSWNACLITHFLHCERSGWGKKNMNFTLLPENVFHENSLILCLCYKQVFIKL